MAWASSVVGDSDTGQTRAADWLDSDQPIDYELAAGETHRYAFHLRKDQYLEIEVEQLGIDVVLDFFGPDNVRLANFDSPTQNQGSEIAFLVTEKPGKYHLEVRTAYLHGEQGRYRIRRRELRKATPKDHHRRRFQKLWLAAKAPSESDQATPRDWQRTLKIYDEMIDLARLADDRLGEAWALAYMTGVYQALEQPIAALATARTALGLWEQLDHRGMMVRCYLTISNIYSNLGETAKAFNYAQRALKLSQRIENRRWTGVALSHLGRHHMLTGEFHLAIEYNQAALPIWRAEGLADKEIRTLNTLAWLHQSQEEFEQAITYYSQTVKLSDASDRWRYEFKTSSFFGIARCMASMGRDQEAAEYVRLALESSRRLGKDRLNERHDAFYTHLKPAEVDERLGLIESALAKYYQALALFKATDASEYLTDTLYRIARLEAQQDRLQPALIAIQAATAELDSRRAEIRGDRFRALYLASQEDYYELWIDVLMRLHKSHPQGGHDARALETFERSRARSLLEALKEDRHAQRNADPGLLAKERHLSSRLSDHIVAQADPSNDSDDLMPDIELTDLLSELRETQDQIRTRTRRDGESLETLSLREIHQQVLDETTLLLAYALGEERSYLWALTKTSLESFELRGRAELEDRAKRAHELLATRGHHKPFETPDAYRHRVKQADVDYSTAAAELSDMLLAPVAPLLQDRRILVVGEGVLQTLPFGALPKPGRPDSPLIVDHEIVSAPSASVVAAIRQRQTQAAPEKTLAMVADPRLPTEKRNFWQRLSALLSRGESSASEEDLLKTAPLERLAELPSLPGAREEAEAILRLVVDEERLEALGPDASRALVQSGALRSYRIVHFATHALLDNRHPDLSGIVLSLVDEDGAPQDGFLRLHEVYDLELEADLVVLSACQTGLGQPIRGEGLEGLSRGFLRAGAAAVVASLWSPEDAATADLMILFYRGMLSEGLTPAAALRAAQVEILRAEETRAPYYWASFALQGDWRPRARH